MHVRDDDATRKKALQTKGFRVQFVVARVVVERAVQRKCLTASDGSCLIVRYFFITWESAATLNTSELLDRVAEEASIVKSDERVLNTIHEVAQPAHRRGQHQVLSELLMRGVPEQERRDCQWGSPRPEGVVEPTGSS
jgi:hypothetical protein